MKEWQRQNLPHEQQVEEAIRFVEKSLKLFEKRGTRKDLIINIRYPESVVKAVQEHYENRSNLTIQSCASARKAGLIAFSERNAFLREKF